MVMSRDGARVAVITGAARGLGQAMALRLARDGANVVLADIRPVAETAKLVHEFGRSALEIECDVSREADVAALEARVRNEFGGADILVNNAAIFPHQPFRDVSYSDWKRVLTVNLDSMFLLAKALTPTMEERRWGRVINIASNTLGLVIPSLVHYVASKAGVVGFTRALATELGELGITVNAIAPGLTHTEGTDAFVEARTFQAEAGRQAIKRNGRPSDLVGAVSFFASDDAAFITGQTLYVDGGLIRV
jgi:NAD(P)-dependent dehydrogenase (short-subunit alcohol dehydrogenase family)